VQPMTACPKARGSAASNACRGPSPNAIWTTKALHRFKAEEPQATARPSWSFDIEIPDGGYVEEAFHPDLGRGWDSEVATGSSRKPIVSMLRTSTASSGLPSGEC
jgi:hypothetical protein